jgi:hypothetical protein
VSLDIKKQDSLSVISPKKRQKQSRRFFLVAGILSVALISYVFASSTITINGGDPVTLGSGVVSVTSCDNSIKLDIQSDFETSTAKFKVTNFKISDIATRGFRSASTDFPGCAGTDLRVNFYHKTPGSFEILDCAQLGYANNTDISDGIEPSPQFATCIDTPDKGSVFLRVLRGDGDPAKYEIKNFKFETNIVDLASIISVAHDYPVTVGSVGPGGGTIFYISAVGFPCGTDLQLICHFLEVAPKGWSGSTIDPKFPYAIPAFATVSVPGIQNTPSKNFGVTMGEGLFDTLAIEAQNGACESPASCTYAAGASHAYAGGGYHDWYLPNQAESSYLAGSRINYAKFKIETINERTDLTMEQRIQGGQDYWNSWAGNPGAPNAATSTTFGGGNSGYAGGYKGKDSLFRVRPIRAY